MADDVILELTELLCKEHKEGNKEKFVMTREELLRFCIKMMKIVKRIEEIENENKFTRIEQLFI